MGWWGFGPLSGDLPLDMVGNFAHAIGVKRSVLGIPRFAVAIDDASFFPETPRVEVDGYPFTREKIEAGLSTLYALIRESEIWRIEVGFQVLGYLVLKYGCEIPDTLRREIIEAAETDTEWDGENSIPRRNEMVRLIEAMRAHKPGMITDLGYVGVMETVLRGEGLL